MREKQINVRIGPLAFFLAAVMFLSLHLPSARAQQPPNGNEANEPDYGNQTEQGEEAGPDEPYDPEQEARIRHQHVLAILNLYYKAAREQRRNFAKGEYEEASTEEDAAGRAVDKNPGSPEAVAAKQKARERWEKAHHEWEKLVNEEDHAEADAEDEYRKLPPSLRKALEDPLHHTPTFSGLPDADKLREAYEYSRAKVEEQQRAEAEERHPGGQKEQAPAPAPQGEEEERQPIGMLAPNLKATVVGIVEARSGNPGELASLSVVTNPDDLEGTPGLLVKKVTIALPRDRHGRASLNGVVVRPAHGKQQPAGEPVTYTVPSGSSLPVSITLAETAASLAEVTVPLAEEKNPHERSSDFTMLPVMPDSGIALVHGPFHGDASKTRIAVNGESAKVLAETTREVFFEPRHLRDGRNNVTVSEGSRTASLALIAPKLAIGAAKTMLTENESTDIKVTVSALNDLPESAWKSGTPAELYDPSAWSGARNGGTNGKLLLTIKNDSPDVIMMAGATGNTVTIPLGRDDLNNGTYEWTGSVTARRAGSFNLEATVVPLLAEVGAAESPISVAAREPDQKSAERERRPKSSDEPKDENSDGETVVEGGGGIPVGMPTPTLKAPPENPENPVPHGPKKTTDCPERGKGCAALIIDVRGMRSQDEDKEEKDAIKSIKDTLDRLKCDVDMQVGDFQIVEGVKVDPKPVRRETIGGRTNRPIIHVTVTGSDKETIKKAELHNIEEWKKINTAIAAHQRYPREWRSPSSS